MRSIRSTLLISTTTSVTILLVISGLLLFTWIRGRLIDRFEYDLLQKLYLVEILGEFVDVVDESIDAEIKKDSTDVVEDSMNMKPDLDDETRAYMQVWDQDGNELYRSPTLQDLVWKTEHGLLVDDVTNRWIELPGGRPGRALDGHVLLDNPPLPEGSEATTLDFPSVPAADMNAVRVTIALDATDLLADIVFLRNALLGVGVCAMALQYLVLWRLIQQSLRPVLGLATQIESLDECVLDERLPVDLPVELIPILERLNGFLQRLQAAFMREKEFSDDVAHELRTPLTILQLKFDLALSENRSADTLREMFAECQIVGRQLQNMVNGLLTLSRIESGQIPLEWQAIQLTEVLQRTWQTTSSQTGKDLAVHWNLQHNCKMTTDLQLFERVASNLFDNAANYTNDGGQVTISTIEVSNTIVLSVVNSGSRLTQQQAEQALDRFWRLDTARQDDGTHIGLGLSLVAKIIETLGGHLEATSAVGADFSIVITLPCNRVF